MIPYNGRVSSAFTFNNVSELEENRRKYSKESHFSLSKYMNTNNFFNIPSKPPQTSILKTKYKNTKPLIPSESFVF